MDDRITDSTVWDQPSKFTSTVDFAIEGVQHGHLTIPHSRNDSPWGSILLPLSVFHNGDGPTVLLTGANHGDEFEGPVALLNLIRSLDIEKVSGRVIIIPALNYPAFKTGTRLSPIDGKNMNRAFPGDRDGTVTEAIADYVQRFVLPLCDAVVDIHAGGRMMRFLPTAVIHNLPDPDHMARTVAAANAFGAPNTLILEELDAAGMLDTAVEDMGKVFISTELGGGGTTSPETVRIAETGVHDVLVHFGILDDLPVGPGETRFLETPPEGFVIAEDGGLIDFLVELGDRVKEGEPMARIQDIDAPLEEPAVYRAPCDGLVMHRHDFGWIKRGDCLSVLARESESA
jgi:N-alpha-acetyl-L-2,4-diaminobutyrate deacetylase